MISGRTVVDGRFELLEPLGSGGMGTVWRAYDLALHREVALKEVRAADPDGTASPAGAQRERVLREARALARIGHPNVVTVHHIVDSDAAANPWIVMELVRGRTLADHLAYGPMPPAQAAQIGRGVLAALRAAHSVGVLHRDIKPANVILREDGTPVLTDFGIAAINGLGGLTSTGNLVGSLNYVAPERLSGQEGNPASDLWSLGLMLYVAVEGYHPMQRDTTVATLAAVLKGEVPTPQRTGALTPALQAVLVPNPDHRPSAEAMDEMLVGAIHGPAPSVYGPALSVRSPRKSRPPGARRVVVVTGVAVASLVAVSVLVIVLRSESVGSQAIPSPIPGTTLPSGTIASTGMVIPPTRTAADSTDLLSPSGVRQAIAALEKATGGTDFTETTIYPNYVDSGAPVQGQPTLFDVFVYRDGVGSRKGAGGELTEPTVKLGSINWDILPTLFRTAEEKLGIPKPTLRYVIVNPSWTFNNDQPTILVYLTDDYGSAYLAASPDGTVVRMYARGR